MWAHVSPSLQDWIYDQDPSNQAINEMQLNLKSMAAKEMLYYDTYERDHTSRIQFYNELNALNGDGYPHQSYNVAVSNGNFTATYGYGDIGRALLTLKVNDLLFQTVNAVQNDCGTGSMISDITTTRFGDLFPNPIYPVYYEMQIIFNPAYIPTYSSLDLVNYTVNNTTGNIDVIGTSKFNDYVVQTTPVQHHVLTTTTRSKIASWLNQNFNIGVNYNFVEGGSANPDNYQVQILHGIPITVQPKNINVNGTQITFNFLKWEDGNTNNPRTFYASHNLSHTATMKAHLASNTSTATAYGGQRKLAVDINGYHLVYESMGNIYYTESTNGGATWSPDLLISSGTGTARNPSISEPSEETAALYVFWVDNASRLGGYSVYAKEYYHTYYVNTWYPAEEVGGSNYLLRGRARKYAKPSGVALNDDGIRFLTTFEDTTSSLDIIARNSDEGNPWSFYGIPGAPTSSKNPSMFCDSPYGGGKIYVAYDNNSDVYMSYSNSTGTPSFSSPSTVSNSGYASPNLSPSVSVDGYGRVHFAWQAFDHSMYYKNSVFHRSLSWQGFNWSTITQFVGYYPIDEAALGAHTDANGGATLMMHGSDNSVWKATSTNGTSWNSSPGNPGTVISTNASYPNLVCRADPASVPYILTRVNTTPYAISIGVRNENNGTGTIFYKGESVTGRTKFAQALQVEDTAAGLSASIELSNIEVGQQGKAPIGVQVEQKGDSLSQQPKFSLSPSVNSSFSGSTVTLGFKTKVNVSEANTPVVLSLALIDQQTKRSMLNLAQKNVAGKIKQADDSLVILTVPLSVLQSNPELVVFVNGEADTNAQVTLINTYFLGDTTGLGKEAQPFVMIPPPTEYDLDQNYPNAFNPTTTITYQIPKDGQVTLKVYDMLGREVKTLVDGYKSVGRYSVAFDGATLSSGIYFYTLRSGDYSAVKKMVLLK